MTNSEAVMIITGKTPDCSREEINSAWQHLVDTGYIWQMPPRWGQIAACMMSAGTIERNAA